MCASPGRADKSFGTGSFPRPSWAQHRPLTIPRAGAVSALRLHGAGQTGFPACVRRRRWAIPGTMTTRYFGAPTKRNEAPAVARPRPVRRRRRTPEARPCGVPAQRSRPRAHPRDRCRNPRGGATAIVPPCSGNSGFLRTGECDWPHCYRCYASAHHGTGFCATSLAMKPRFEHPIKPITRRHCRFRPKTPVVPG